MAAQIPRRTKTKAFRGTKKDALRELRRIETSIDVGAYVDPGRQTLADYLGLWVQSDARQRVSPKTFERYTELAECLIGLLGTVPLTRLTPAHVQEAYRSLLENGRKDGYGGLSRQTVLHHHKLLNRAFGQAVKWQLLSRNPLQGVSPPRPDEREITVIGEQDLRRLLLAAAGTRLRTIVLLATTTGMRRGEILALRWDDVDLDGASLTVSQSLEETKEGLRVKRPKTSRGRRTIALPETTVVALRDHRTAQSEHRLKLGPDWIDNDLVCCKDDGAFLRPRGVTKDFAKLVKRLGLSITLHGLRHTYLTNLLRGGVHPRIASEIAGHSGVAITLDTYSHVMPDMQRDAARLIDRFVREEAPRAPSGSKSVANGKACDEGY